MENFEKQPVRRSMIRKSMGFGILVLTLGLALLLRNLGIFEETNIWQYIFSWQMLVIAIGVINVAINDGRRGFGWILIAVGGFFLLNKIYDWPATFSNVFWPGLIIVVGLVLIFGNHGRKWRRSHSYFKSSGEDVIEEVSVFGGRERSVHSDKFRGGEIVNVFGGGKLDLTNAILVPEGAEIEIVAVFGGSTLVVPSDWNVKLEVLNIFGGFSDKRMKSQVDLSKVLVVKGVAIFGGGELKSF